MPTEAPRVEDRRLHVVGAAHFVVHYKRYFEYSEGDDRMDYLTKNAKPFQIDPTIHTDCSGSFRLLYFWAGAPDPFGSDYKDPEGYTGTIIERGHEISRSEARGGDAVVFGPGTGEHVATIIEGGANPVTMSFGDNPPGFYTVDADGRLPERYFRFATHLRPGFVA